jgi:hypothetical protein
MKTTKIFRLKSPTGTKTNVSENILQEVIITEEYKNKSPEEIIAKELETGGQYVILEVYS